MPAYVCLYIVHNMLKLFLTFFVGTVEVNDLCWNIYMDRTINGFFKVALEDMNRKGETMILCPCKKCENIVLIDPFTGRVKMHLLKYDFMPGYTRWTSHGEEEEDTEVEGEVHHDELE